MSVKNSIIAELIPANTSVQFLEEGDNELLELLGQQEKAVVAEKGECLVIGEKTLDELKTIIAENDELARNIPYIIVQPTGDLLEYRKAIGKDGFEILRNKMVTNEDGYEFIILFSAKLTRSEYGNHYAENLEDENTTQADKDLNKLVDLMIGWDIVATDADVVVYIDKLVADWKEEAEQIKNSENPDNGLLEIIDAKIAGAGYARGMAATISDTFSDQMLSALNVGSGDIDDLLSSFASLQASLDMFSLQIEESLTKAEDDNASADEASN